MEPERPLGNIDGEELEQWLCEHSRETLDCSKNLDASRGDIVLARVDGTDYTLKSWDSPTCLAIMAESESESLWSQEEMLK